MELIRDPKVGVVPGLLPRMALEPPDGYVAFVARHLEWLRDEAVRAAGDEHDGDTLYPEVLSDVARWWGWLELRRRVLHQYGAAEGYLQRALVRRVRRWESEQTWGRADEPWSGEIDVWCVEPAGGGLVYAGHSPARPGWSNAAARLAPYLRPTARVDVGPLAEASIAWWHAYEARRRRRLIAILVVILVLVAVLMRVQAGAADALVLFPLRRVLFPFWRASVDG